MWVAAAHAALGVLAAFALLVDAAPVDGVHPALKPMRFGFSIALFLASMAVLVPALSVRASVREGLAWTLAATMMVEMIPIIVQAGRGTGSHFNVRTPLDAGLWRLMTSAIAVAVLAMLIVTVVAWARPLLGRGGTPLSPVVAAAWRLALVFFFLATVTGVRMAGQASHTSPGGGDLRIPHFIGVHTLQTLPLVGLALARAPLDAWSRWALFAAVAGLHLAAAGWAWVKAT